MSPDNVDILLYNWIPGYDKGFKYVDPDLFGVEWLVIQKESDNLYTVLEKKSSIKIGPFNKVQIQKLLGSNKLELYDNNFGADYKYKKSNGCTCGAWSTRDPDCHSPRCDKVRKK